MSRVALLDKGEVPQGLKPFLNYLQFGTTKVVP